MHIKIDIPLQREENDGILGRVFKQITLSHSDIILEQRIPNDEEESSESSESILSDEDGADVRSSSSISSSSISIYGSTYHLYVCNRDTDYEIRKVTYDKVMDLLKKLNIEEAEVINEKHREIELLSGRGDSPFDISEVNAITGLEVE